MDIEKTYQIPAPLAEVFSAWVSPNTVIAPAERMEIHPREGGDYILHMPDGSAMRGVFQKYEPDHLVSYTWCWQGDEETTLVTVRFFSTEAHTRIELRHTGFSSQASHDMHALGWDHYIAGFREHLNQR